MMATFQPFTRLLLATCLSICLAVAASKGQDRLDEPPINYQQTRGENPLSRLADRVQSGEVTLEYEPGYGQLRSILRELAIPVSSQSLVFSKLSLQRGRISPQNPRAIYFNDDVYVGWVRGSSLLEVSTSDPHLGAAFYTISMYPQRASIRRENNRCLSCHEEYTDQGNAPLHMVRSVMTRPSGTVNLLLDEFVTDHTSPLSERWGGWYVTGSAGGAKHMGNSFLDGEQLVPHRSLHRNDLTEDFDTEQWPTPYSDIAALMVLEHQTQMHNRFTRAEFSVRRARHALAEGTIDQTQWAKQLDAAADLVVDHLLFVDEATLEHPLIPSNTFVEDFQTGGPRDSKGRSLRQLDLTRRLFRYPCSYLIHSNAFDALDTELRGAVFDKLVQILSGDPVPGRFSHLSENDRRAVREILTETNPEFRARSSS